MGESKVTVREVDVSSYEVPKAGTDPMGISGVVKGPIKELIFYGPKIKPIKWYQFWRWHLISRYNEECIQARLLVLRDFGQPSEDM